MASLNLLTSEVMIPAKLLAGESGSHTPRHQIRGSHDGSAPLHGHFVGRCAISPSINLARITGVSPPLYIIVIT